MSSGVIERGLAVVDAFAMGAQRLRQRVAQALFVRAALRRGDGVAIGMQERLGFRRPGDRPFDRALAVAVFGAAGEAARRDRRAPCRFRRVRKSSRPPGKFSVSSAGIVVRLDQRRIAFPADFDAAEQIGLRARHAVELRRREMRVLAENLRIGLER